jgi:hypothetical protein
MDNNWISVKEKMPPVGVVIDTKIDDENGVRNETQLVFDNPLWFFPDHKMYVYYKPTHWKPTNTNP